MFMSLMRKTQRTAKEFMPGKGALRLLSVMAMLLFATTPIAHSAVPETEVKAAFLFNFAKFVTWPAQAFSSETAPIQLAVFGDEETTSTLKLLLSDKKAHGRSFEVKRISNPQDAKNSQIVYVTSTESRRTSQVLEATRKLPILTVGESDQFLDLGGMINFLFEDSQLRFEINTEPAEKVKLEISSKLLRLGKKRSPK
jgi:hypothetical protein